MEATRDPEENPNQTRRRKEGVCECERARENDECLPRGKLVLNRDDEGKGRPPIVWKLFFSFFPEGGNKTIDLNSGSWSFFFLFLRNEANERARESVKGITKCRTIVYRKNKVSRDPVLNVSISKTTNDEEIQSESENLHKQKKKQNMGWQTSRKTIAKGKHYKKRS